MYWKSDDFSSAEDVTEMAAMRDELRDIARHLRTLSTGAVPTETIGDQIRAQIERIQLPRAA